MINKYVIVDCEADGPVPHLYSMISLGAVQLDNLENTFYAEMSPISDNYMQQALGVTGFTRGQTLEFRNPESVMLEFKEWLDKIKCDRLTFVSDNASFDFAYVNYYFYKYLGHNPFGYSPMSITWLYKGLVNDTWKSFKHLRTTKHTHNALDDAMGNAGALLKMNEQFKLGLI